MNRPIQILSYYGSFNWSPDEERNELETYDCRIVLPNGQRYRTVVNEVNLPAYANGQRFPCTLFKVAHWRGIDQESILTQRDEILTLGQSIAYYMKLEGLEYGAYEIAWVRATTWQSWWRAIANHEDYSFYRGVAEAVWEGEKAAHPTEWDNWRRRYSGNEDF